MIKKQSSFHLPLRVKTRRRTGTSTRPSATRCVPSSITTPWNEDIIWVRQVSALSCWRRVLEGCRRPLNGKNPSHVPCCDRWDLQLEEIFSTTNLVFFLLDRRSELWAANGVPSKKTDPHLLLACNVILVDKNMKALSFPFAGACMVVVSFGSTSRINRARVKASYI